jgi:hypothetical protein
MSIWARIRPAGKQVARRNNFDYSAPMTEPFRIICRYDDEAHVWYVAESDIPGVCLDAPTIEQLKAKLRLAAPEMAELNAHAIDGPVDRPILFVCEQDLLAAE